MDCTTCQAPLVPGGRFCGSCGATLDQRAEPTGQWKAAGRIAATTLGTSLLVAVLFGLASRPAFGNLHWGFKTSVAWVAWVWESIFGVDLTAHGHGSGTLSVMGFGTNGDASASASLGAMPLTLTVITLAVAIAVFRKATEHSPSAVSVLLLGARAALLTAVPLGVISLLVSLDDRDLIALLNVKSGDHDTIASTVQDWQALGSDRSLTLSLSATQAFLVSFVVLLIVFAAVVLCRSGGFAGRWGSAQQALVIAIQAAGRLAAALVVSGLLYELVIWQVRWHTAWPPGSFHGQGKPPHLSAAQWVDSIAAAIAYAGNVGLVALGLGSGSTTGLTASGSGSMSGFSMAGSTDGRYGIVWWAQTDHLAAGVWLAVLITPVVLTLLARSVARSQGRDPRAMVAALATWVASLVVLIPLLLFLANLTASGSAKAHTSLLGFINGTASADGSAGFGPPIVLTTATLTIYAAVVSAIVAISARRSPGVGTAPPSSPR